MGSAHYGNKETIFINGRYLTFCGLYITIYLRNKDEKDALFFF